MVDYYLPGELSVFINSTNVTPYIRQVRWKISKNDIPTVELTIDRYTDALTDIDIGNRITIAYDQICLGTGVLEKPSTTSKKNMAVDIRLLGTNGTTLFRSTVAKYDYVDVAQDEIIKRLLTSDDSGTGNWVLEAGTVDSNGSSTVRVENTDRLTPVLAVCDDNDLWAEISHPAQVETLEDSYTEATYSGDLPLYTGSLVGIAQSFTNTPASVLSSCKFYLKKVGVPTGSMVAKLYAHTGTYGTTSKPTGNPLAVSNVIDSSTLTTSYALITFDFEKAARYEMGATTYYCIVLEYDNAASNITNYVSVGIDTVTLTASGNSAYWTGSLWVEDAAVDVPFYVYSRPFETWSTDYFNAYDWTDAAAYPAKNTATITFEPMNALKITRNYDMSRCVNHVRLLGAGDGRDQFEAICYHATDNRSKLTIALDTWLTSDITAAAVTIDVTSTAGFPATGSFEIDQERISYTGKTATSFTTCTRGASSTVATVHTSDSEVINVVPTVINVVDSSNFPTPGSVWIGLEKISYTTAPTGTTLGGTIVRGVAWNGTPAYAPAVKYYYAHGTECFVMDAQYTPTSTEAGSSIAVYGYLGSIQTDTKIIDQNALDVAAGYIIEIYNTPPEIVTVVTTVNYLTQVWLGDMITIDDPYQSGVDDDYRIYSMEYVDSPGAQGKLTLVCGNDKFSFSKEQAQTRKELGNLSVYAQGVPQTITINKDADCDGTGGTKYTLEMEAPIPDEAISIDRAKLSYKLSKYRTTYSTTTSANTAGTSLADNACVYDLGDCPAEGSWDAISGCTTGAIAVDGDGIFIRVSGCMVIEYNCASSGGWLLEGLAARITRTGTGGTVYYPSSDGVCVTTGYLSHTHEYYYWDGSGTQTEWTETQTYAETPSYEDINVVPWFFDIFIPENPNGRTYTLELDLSDHLSDLSCQESLVNLSYEVHSRHTHDVEYGVTEGPSSWDTTDIKIYVDAGNGYVDQTAAIEAIVGTLPYLQDNKIRDIDIAPYLGDSPGWKRIKIETDGRCNIDGTFNLKYFETNRT